MVDLRHVREDMHDTGCHFHRANDVAQTLFQVLGERGSGTNLTRRLIDLNCEITRTEALGWKHGFPISVGIPDNLTVVCVFRNAADWALSMYKRPWHAHPDLQALPFSDFIRAEWHSIIDRTSDFELVHPELKVDGAELQYDRHPLTGKRFENLFALRRAKMKATLGMLNRDCNVTLVKMETIVEAGEAFMLAFQTAYGIKAKDGPFRTETRRMGTRWRASVADRAPAPDTMSEADRAFMLSQLDLPVEAFLGYRY